jgi:hypothetical protein
LLNQCSKKNCQSRRFFNQEDEQEIVEAIRMAENTSGEIRVHIEKTTWMRMIVPWKFS